MHIIDAIRIQAIKQEKMKSFRIEHSEKNE